MIKRSVAITASMLVVTSLAFGLVSSAQEEKSNGSAEKDSQTTIIRKKLRTLTPQSIPVNPEFKIYRRLAANQAWIGLHLRAPSDEDKERLGLPDTSGALIQEVRPETPGHKAGFKHDDVIVEIDKKPMAKPEDVIAEIRSHKPGDKISVVVRREKNLQSIETTLGTVPDDFKQLYRFKGPEGFPPDNFQIQPFQFSVPDPATAFSIGKSVTCTNCKRTAMIQSIVPGAKQCPKCKRPGRPGYRFCPYDGTELPGQADAEPKYCPYCGKELAGK